MKRNASYTLLALGLTAFLLHGCGGGDTGAPAGVNAGDARTAGAVIIIHWPTANSRFLHQRSDSVRVKVYADVAPGEAGLPEGDEPVASKSATRSGGEGTSEIQFERLPLYDLRFVVEAFASDKPGTILSRAETRTRLQPGASEPLEFTLESETAQIKIEPSPVALNTGQSVTLTVQALNADGQVILSSPDDFTFVSGNTAIATVDQSGAVTGVSVGATTVTVGERGTGDGVTPTTVSAVVGDGGKAAWPLMDSQGRPSYIKRTQTTTVGWNADPPVTGVQSDEGWERYFAINTYGTLHIGVGGEVVYGKHELSDFSAGPAQRWRQTLPPFPWQGGSASFAGSSRFAGSYPADEYRASLEWTYDSTWTGSLDVSASTDSASAEVVRVVLHLSFHDRRETRETSYGGSVGREVTETAVEVIQELGRFDWSAGPDGVYAWRRVGE